MNRADAISRLKAHADTLKTMGATSLYLFGSTARNAARPASDVDVFIDYDLQGRFNAFDLVSIKLFLEKEFERLVDLTTRNGLHSMLKADIEQAAVRVF